VGKLGRAVQPHLKVVMPALVDKLADNKIVVQQHDVKVLQRLCTALSPAAVLDHLLPVLGSRQPRAREQAIGIVTFAVLTNAAGFPPGYPYGDLATRVAALAADPEPRVVGAALDCLAVLGDAAGVSLVEDAVVGAGLPPAAERSALSRLEDPARPAMGENGVLEGAYAARPDSGRSGVSGGGYGGSFNGRGRASVGSSSPPQYTGSAAPDPWGGGRAGRRGPPSPSPPSTGSAPPVGMANLDHGGGYSPPSYSPRAGRRAGAGPGTPGPILSPRMASPTKDAPSQNARYGAGLDDTFNETAGPSFLTGIHLAGGAGDADPGHGGHGLAPAGYGNRSHEQQRAAYGTVRQASRRDEEEPASSDGSAAILPGRGLRHSQSSGMGSIVGGALSEPDPRAIVDRSASDRNDPSSLGLLGDVDGGYADKFLSEGKSGRHRPPQRSTSGEMPRGRGAELSSGAPRLPLALQRDLGDDSKDVDDGQYPYLEPSSPQEGRALPSVTSKLSILKERNAQWRRNNPRGTMATSGNLDEAGAQSRESGTTGSPSSLYTRGADPLRDMGLPPRLSDRAEQGGGRRPRPARPVYGEETRLPPPADDERDTSAYGGSLQESPRRPPTQGLRGASQHSMERTARMGALARTGSRRGNVSQAEEGGMPAGRGLETRDGSSPRGGPGALAGPKEIGTAELTPLGDPEAQLRRALSELERANSKGRKELDWVAQFEALNVARRAVVHHPEVVQPYVRPLTLALVPAVEALRSLTAKTAMMSVQEMVVSLGRSLDSELEHLVPVLLKRAGEVSVAGRENFLASEADAALSQIIVRASETRSASLLLQQTGHKNPNTRTKIASKLDELLNTHGTRMLGNRQLLDQLLTAALKFTTEAKEDTRTFGKRMLWELKRLVGASGGDLSQMIGNRGDARARQAALAMFQKEAGPPPAPRPQTRAPPSRASQHPSTAPPQFPFEGSGPTANRLRTAGSRQRPRPAPPGPNGVGRAATGDAVIGAGSTYGMTYGAGGLVGSAGLSDDPEVEEQLPGILEDLAKRDFRDRIRGIKSLTGLVRSKAQVSEPSMVKILEAMTARVQDGNTKVVAEALDALRAMFPTIGDAVAPGLNVMIPCLATSLGSTNERVRQAASSALSTLVGSADQSLLVQHMAHCVSHSSGRGKAAMILSLQGIVEDVYARRPHLVVKHVVPAAFTVLGDSKVDVKSANQELIATLHRVLGNDLTTAAANLSQPLRQRLDMVLGAA